MKVLTVAEYKYYTDEEDVKLINDNCPRSLGLTGLADKLGITYQSLYRKMNTDHEKYPNYFQHLEILMIEKILGITFNKH